MSTIDVFSFPKYAQEIVNRVDDVSDLSNHDIRRYVEKALHLEKKALVGYEEELRKCVNDAILSKSEQTAKENVKKGEAAPLVVDEVDKLLDDIENSEEDNEEDGLREGESPDPEPRRIGCPFYFFIESKLRKKWNDRKTESLYAFTKKMHNKWQLLSDEEKSVSYSFF